MGEELGGVSCKLTMAHRHDAGTTGAAVGKQEGGIVRGARVSHQLTSPRSANGPSSLSTACSLSGTSLPSIPLLPSAPTSNLTPPPHPQSNPSPSLELIVWLVPSLLGGAISVALVGLLLGPFFPIAMNQAARILPGFLLTPSIGWIAGIGQAGSAVLPFVTGALAQGAGIGSLQPL